MGQHADYTEDSHSGKSPNKLKELLPFPNKNRDANQRKRSKAQSKIASTQTQERHQALPGKRLKTTLGRKAGRRLNLITEDQPAAGRTLPWCARFGLTGDSSHYIAHVTDSPVLKTARFRTNCNVRSPDSRESPSEVRTTYIRTQDNACLSRHWL